MTYKIIRRFIPLAFLATALCCLVYLVAQQSLRQDANDPQIQMAEDTATQLQMSTSTAAMVVPTGTVNIAESLAPYVVVYNGLGNPIAGDGMLNGALPKLPSGVFDSTGQSSGPNGEDRITWEPQAGLREAIVLVRVHHPASLTSLPTFVMAGRSLREVELRESQVEFEVGAIWLATILGLLILEIIFAFTEKRRS